ncbi:MAG TPA: sigma-70 family RNA polymerase sigma factor [Longimicrobiales bacterium]|nr:sigma-70 family RNA polymerase sigma factor [Longimicrobiales bacterium]
MCASDRAAHAGTLFQENHEALLRFLVRLTGDPDMAADVAQDSFVCLLERPPREWSRTWLFRVATNLVRDRQRALRRRRLRLLGADHRVPRADPTPMPDAAIEAAQHRRAVAAALAALAPKERIALLMREEGFTQREIADAIGTTTKSVGTLTARAIRKLARILGPELEAR